MTVNGRQVRPEEGPQTAIEATLQVTEALQRIGRFLREHPAILLPSLYVYVSAIGVLYTWCLFRHFGINVMDFAEASDFLLAAFKEPMALGLSFFGVMYAVFVLYAVCFLLWFCPRVSSRWRKGFSHPPVPIRAVFAMNVLPFIAYTVFACNLVACGVTRDIKTGDAPGVIVQLESGGDSAIASQSEYAVTLIGTTQEFAFCYDRQEEATYILPISRIRRIIVHVESTAATNATRTPTQTAR
jgi:hypothetical protein